MRSSLFLGLLLLSPCLSSATERVDLAAAVHEALANRPLARAAAEEARAAEAAVGEARSGYLPRVVLTETFTRTDEPAGGVFIRLNQERLSQADMVGAPDSFNFPPVRQDFETRLTLEQNLYDPAVTYGLSRARKGAAAAESGARWSAEEAAFSAFRAYLEVQATDAALAWAESSREEAAETLRQAALRREGGVGLKADELRARVALSEAERRLLGARNDLTIARRRLALALGREGGEVDIAVPIAPAFFAGKESPPAARADLEALRLQSEEARLAHRQSGADYLPRLGVGASYALHDPDIPFGDEAGHWAVQATLRWEIFDGLRRSETRARTGAARRVADLRSREAQNQARLASEEAQLRAEEARLHLGMARQAVDAALESHQILTERYKAGLTNLTDLLAGQAALDRARADAADAESRLVLAEGNVHFQNGTFLQTMLSAQEGNP